MIFCAGVRLMVAQMQSNLNILWTILDTANAVVAIVFASTVVKRHMIQSHAHFRKNAKKMSTI